MNNPNSVCENCYFLKPDTMECRRRAPDPAAEVRGGASVVNAVWPIVANDDWCGEFVKG